MTQARSIDEGGPAGFRNHQLESLGCDGHGITHRAAQTVAVPWMSASPWETSSREVTADPPFVLGRFHERVPPEPLCVVSSRFVSVASSCSGDPRRHSRVGVLALHGSVQRLLMNMSSTHKTSTSPWLPARGYLKGPGSGEELENDGCSQQWSSRVHVRRAQAQEVGSVYKHVCCLS